MKNLNKIKLHKTQQKVVDLARVALSKLLLQSRKSSFSILKISQKTMNNSFQKQQRLFSKKSLKKLEIHLTTQLVSCAMKIFLVTQSLLKLS